MAGRIGVVVLGGYTLADEDENPEVHPGDDPEYDPNCD